MAMLYTLKKQKNRAMPSAGQYVARTLHAQTVTSETIEKEIEANTSARRSDVILVLTELAYVLSQHLRNGDIVKLKDIGTLKLEISGKPAASPQAFRKDKHICGVKLHVIPESSNGKPKLYQDMEYKQR